MGCFYSLLEWCSIITVCFGYRCFDTFISWKSVDRVSGPTLRVSHSSIRLSNAIFCFDTLCFSFFSFEIQMLTSLLTVLSLLYWFCLQQLRLWKNALKFYSRVLLTIFLLKISNTKFYKYKIFSFVSYWRELVLLFLSFSLPFCYFQIQGVVGIHEFHVWQVTAPFFFSASFYYVNPYIVLKHYFIDSDCS